MDRIHGIDKEYRKTYRRAGAAEGWHFLTGREEDIQKVAEAVGFRYRYSPEQRQWRLIRPGLLVAVLFSMAVAAVAVGETADWPRLAHALLGTGLVIAGASAMNQVLERRADASMSRTATRPLPAGGAKVAAVVDPSGRLAGRVAVFGAAGMLLVSLAPMAFASVAWPYGVVAVGFGLVDLASAGRFLQYPSDATARALWRVSLVHLPALLAVLLLAV
ncbi:MAG: UbiA family prenyltransferase [Planctomycetia bacterium]|nr:UbiA family prenyltransferase [Planctomycetia bacterium]